MSHLLRGLGEVKSSPVCLFDRSVLSPDTKLMIRSLSLSARLSLVINNFSNNFDIVDIQLPFCWIILKAAYSVKGYSKIRGKVRGISKIIVTDLVNSRMLLWAQSISSFLQLYTFNFEIGNRSIKKSIKTVDHRHYQRISA